MRATAAHRPLSAVIGLGFSSLSRQWIGSTRDLAGAAVINAVADAGMSLKNIDGLILNRSPSAPVSELPLRIQDDLHLRDLELLTSVESEGMSAVQMIQLATLALDRGMASAVACVFADARIGMGTSGSASFASAMPLTGIDNWELQYGALGAVGPYALEAAHYLARHRLTTDALGAVAVSNRLWATGNALAFLRTPLTLDQYRASRFVAEPLRMLDCPIAVNGAAAVVLVAADRAGDGPHAPVYVHGMGQGHAGARSFAPLNSNRGAQLAAAGAYRMAGIGPAQITACQFYDAFSIVSLLSLEDYGLCADGEAASFVMAGETSPGGRLPMNTGGGHLSSYYLQGMTPVTEAVIQARRAGGARQIGNPGAMLVTGCGGCQDFHGALIVSSEPEL